MVCRLAMVFFLWSEIRDMTLLYPRWLQQSNDSVLFHWNNEKKEFKKKCIKLKLVITNETYTFLKIQGFISLNYKIVSKMLF